MIFDYVRAEEPVINEYFCRGRHSYCKMIYLSRNLFSLNRQSVSRFAICKYRLTKGVMQYFSCTKNF